MHSTARAVCLVVVCASAATLGCGSGLKGKIEGKWKVTAMGDEDAKKGLPPNVDMYMIVDFRADGNMAVEFGSSDPKAADGMKALLGSIPPVKYRVVSNDEIEIYDVPKDEKGVMTGFKENEKAKVAVTGDEMTITPAKGKAMKLTRMK
jgi:hypothetical protein